MQIDKFTTYFGLVLHWQRYYMKNREGKTICTDVENGNTTPS